jgi:four helix bundle protein
MKEGNIIREKSYAFSIRIVKFSRYLIKEKNEFVLSKQILRSGTSIGANIEEAIGAQSKRDFLSKMSISYKEARETQYWLRIIKDSELVESFLLESLLTDSVELCKIIGKILKTLKEKNS